MPSSPPSPVLPEQSIPLLKNKAPHLYSFYQYKYRLLQFLARATPSCYSGYGFVERKIRSIIYVKKSKLSTFLSPSPRMIPHLFYNSSTFPSLGKSNKGKSSLLSTASVYRYKGISNSSTLPNMTSSSTLDISPRRR